MTSINEKLKALHASHREIVAQARSMWPIGSTVGFKIMSNQRNLSTGTVVGYELNLGYSSGDIVGAPYLLIRALKGSAPQSAERSRGEPDACGFVLVKDSAVQWLKKHYPALCEKSGMCERVAGRLYTITKFDAPQPAEPLKECGLCHNMRTLDPSEQPAEPSDPAKCQKVGADELLKHLKTAHAFIENTKAFGRTASHGILQCADSTWDIDASKAAIAAYEAEPVKVPSAPEGYSIVPKQLTKAMIDAGRKYGGLGMSEAEWMGRIACAWPKMLAAALGPQAQPDVKSDYAAYGEALCLAAELSISIKIQYGRLTAKRGRYEALVKFAETGGDRAAAIRLGINRVADAMQKEV